jgi:hypothetical protein
MADLTYRFNFDKTVPLTEVAGTLRLAVLACEGLHGEARVALDAPHHFEPRQRRWIIGGNTAAGYDLARLFETFLNREFGPSAYRVVRLEANHARTA